MCNSQEILLSVIIPHRNIPELLKRCLDYIKWREDLQIIIVDDCSETGLTPPLNLLGQNGQIEFYSTLSPAGGGAARNVGISHAKGRWITFIDADDFFTPNFNDIVDSLNSLPEEVDVLYCAANSLDSKYFTTSDRANTLNHYIRLHQQGDLEGENRLRYTFGEPWCKIVRRKVIESSHIRFSESSIHNDTKYSYLVGHNSRKIATTPYALCTITTRQGSVSKTLSESKKIERISIFAEAHKFFREKSIPQRYVINFLWPQMARSLFENRDTYKSGCKILKENGFSSTQIVLNTLKHICRNKAVALSKKLQDTLFNNL